MMVVSSFAILSMIFPPLSLLSSAGIALVVLRNGFAEGMVVVGGATVAVALLGLLLFGNLAVAIGYGLVLWIPISLVALLLRESTQLSVTVELSVLIAICLVGSIYFFLSDPALLWNERLQTAVTLLLQKDMAEVDQGKIIQGIEKMSHIMSGLMITAALASLMLGLLLARWWQSILYNPGGFRVEFLALKSRTILAYASLMLVLIATLLNGKIAETVWNIIIIALVLYLMVGISVSHKILSAMNRNTMFLTIFYLVMFFIPHALLPIILVGFTDTWFNWRDKLLVS